MRAQKASQVDQELGRRIYKVRYSRGLTGPELAARMGISSQQISKYELGQSRLPVGRLLEICQILRWPARKFLADLPGADGDGAEDLDWLLGLVAEILADPGCWTGFTIVEALRAWDARRGNSPDERRSS